MNFTPEMQAKARETREANRQKAQQAKKERPNDVKLTAQQEYTLKATGGTKDSPTSLFNLLLRCYTDNASAGQCLRAKCLECTNFQRKEITLCNVTSCPLWIKRPYQSEMDGDNE